MSADTHEPMVSGYRRVFLAEETIHQNRARCSCGWIGPWHSILLDVEDDLRAHLVRHRA